MGEKAYITPEVLKWARETARISIEEAARKAGVSDIKRIVEWENGNSQPTIKQAEKLAHAYKRPFAAMFLPVIPEDFELLKDFRNKESSPLSTASIFIIREIQQKQVWLSDRMKEENASPLSIVGKFNTNTDTELVANDILSFFNVDPLNYQSDNPLNEWINKIEEKGIFVSRTSFIHSRLLLSPKEFQGFTIVDPYAPFIFINSKDYKAPQLFTLIHELAHVWINESGISSSSECSFKELQDNRIERFCNEVAGKVLIPDKLFDTVEDKNMESGKSLFRFVKRYGISSKSFLIRAKQIDFISNNTFTRLWGEAEIEFQIYKEAELRRKIKQKELDSGPSQYLLKLLRNGKQFTRIVLDSYRGGIIQPTEASFLLNLQSNKFNKFEEYLYK